MTTKLEVLRCPSCCAPVDGFRDRQAVCGYCGATMAADQPSVGKTETRFSLLLRVGPSNVERIVALLCERIGRQPFETRSRLTQVPCEIELGTSEIDARVLASDLARAGAHVEIIQRSIEIPLVSVLLEDVGANKLATIVAMRQHLDLGLQEARRLVERVPIAVVQAMAEPLARELVSALQKAGARARVG